MTPSPDTVMTEEQKAAEIKRLESVLANRMDRDGKPLPGYRTSVQAIRARLAEIDRLMASE